MAALRKLITEYLHDTHDNAVPSSDTTKSQCCKDKELRDNLSEKQVDKMIIDSFPASDPPSTY